MKTSKSWPKDRDLANAGEALKRAARTALETALRTHTPCYIIKDGMIVDIAKLKSRGRKVEI